MRYRIFVSDYDGTLASHGGVSDETIQALYDLKASNRKLILVTGRELPDLMAVFPAYGIFDFIIAENGALIYNVNAKSEELLGPPPDKNFVSSLNEEGISPLSVGRVIVATWEPHDKKILEIIKKHGIERQLIFNKGAVMILPPGINKATGLTALLKTLHLSLHNTVAVGDAENDSALLQIAECSYAVKNALPSVKELADFSLTADNGKGLVELISSLIANDLATVDANLQRHYLTLGQKENNENFSISPYRKSILLSGISGGGKSTFTAAVAECLMEKNYQFCLIDPEGDYQELPGVIAIGNENSIPSLEEIATMLKNPDNNLVICTLSVPLEDRPAFSSELLSVLLDSRRDRGHPHWILTDEAHHFWPSKGSSQLPEALENFLIISNAPDDLTPEVISQIGMIIIVGPHPAKTLEHVAAIMGMTPPGAPNLSQGQAFVWDLAKGGETFVISFNPPNQIPHRHKKKYARGDLNEKSFFFTGEGRKLNLKANNLLMFASIAEGIDDDTWSYHLKRKDFYHWFRDGVKDDELAELSSKVHIKDPTIAKKIILDFINKKYTA